MTFPKLLACLVVLLAITGLAMAQDAQWLCTNADGKLTNCCTVHNCSSTFSTAKFICSVGGVEASAERCVGIDQPVWAGCDKQDGPNCTNTPPPSWKCVSRTTLASPAVVDCCTLCNSQVSEAVACVDSQGQIVNEELCRTSATGSFTRPTTFAEVCPRGTEPNTCKPVESWKCYSSSKELVDCCQVGCFLDQTAVCLLDGVPQPSIFSCTTTPPTWASCKKEDAGNCDTTDPTGNLKCKYTYISQQGHSITYYNECSCSAFTKDSHIAIHDAQLINPWVKPTFASNPCDLVNSRGTSPTTWTITPVCVDPQTQLPTESTDCFGEQQAQTCECPPATTELVCTVDFKTFQQCDCEKFGSCGRQTINRVCRRLLSNNSYVFLPLSECSQVEESQNPILDCSCEGEWMCNYQYSKTTTDNPSSSFSGTTNQQLDLWAPCNCTGVQYSSFYWNSEEPVGWKNVSLDPCGQTNSSTGKPVTEFTLTRACINWATGEPSDDCPPTEGDDKTCLCKETKYEQRCSIMVNGTNFVVPCADVCKYRSASRDCTELASPTVVCVRSDAPTVQVPDSFCAGNQTQVQAPQCNEIPDHCKFEWECAIPVGTSIVSGQTTTTYQTIDCDIACAVYRRKNPCDEVAITTTCINSSTLQQVNSSFCSNAPTLTPPSCPPSDFCDKSYHWECAGHGVDQFGTEFNVPSANVTIAPATATSSTSCKCTDTCTGYTLTTQCLDQNNNIVSGSNCDPTTNPLGSAAAQWCPITLPNDKCGEQPCERICSLEYYGKLIYFQCEHYKEYCWKFNMNNCGERDVIVKQHCGTLTYPGPVFTQSNSECCKTLKPEWPVIADANTWFNCKDIKTVSTEVNNTFTLLAQEALESVTLAVTPTGSTLPCEYAWKCTHPSTGQIVDCDCDSMTRWVDANGTVKILCDSIKFQPQCHRRSWGGVWHTTPVVPTTPCDIYPKPNGFCNGNPECGRKFQWMCSDLNGNFIPCSSDPCLRNQTCKGSTVIAKCYSATASAPALSPHWNEADCQNSLGSWPFPSSPNTFIYQCPSVPSLCDTTSNAFEWICTVAGNPWMIVPCTCEKIPDVLHERLGCEIKVVAQCIDSLTTSPVSNSNCNNGIGPFTNGAVYDICKGCDGEPKDYQLKCYINGDTSRPIDCKADCSAATGVCNVSYVQAMCTLNGNIVPLSNCQSQLTGLVGIGYGQYDGIRKCPSDTYRPGCNARWMCRTTLNGVTRFFDCSDSTNVCANYPFPRNCKPTKVDNVCVESNGNQFTVISPSHCLGQLQSPPLGSTSAVTLCPQTLSVDCIRKQYYGWMCVDSNGGVFPCDQPTCKSRQHLFFTPPQPCVEFDITADCFSITYDPLNNVIVSQTQAPQSSCPWDQWPIRDTSDYPISLTCRCPPTTTTPTCPLNLGVWPNCRIREIDTPVLLDGGSITWNFNPGDDAEPCQDTGVIIRTDSPRFAWSPTTNDKSATLGNGIFNATHLDTRSLIDPSSTEPITVETTIISPCGEYPGPDITILPWCAKVKCAAPFVCDNLQQACVCPAGTFGKDCSAKCGENSTFNPRTLECQCNDGFVFDTVNGKCNALGSCSEYKEPPFSCGLNGRWSQKTCSCQCDEGYFTPGSQSTSLSPTISYPDIKKDEFCQCMERFFNITLKSKPEQWDNEHIQAIWIKLASQYLATDLQDLPWVYDIGVVTTILDEKTGAWTAMFRFRSCKEEAIAEFTKLYQIFLNYWSTSPSADNIKARMRSAVIDGSAGGAEPMMMETQAQIEANSSTVLGRFVLSDVAGGSSNVGGFTQLSTQGLVIPETEKNGATVISTVVAALLVAVVVILY